MVSFVFEAGSRPTLELTPVLARPLTARFKIMGGLDIADRSRPQSGIMSFLPENLMGLKAGLETRPGADGESVKVTYQPPPKA